MNVFEMLENYRHTKLEWATDAENRRNISLMRKLYEEMSIPYVSIDISTNDDFFGDFHMLLPQNKLWECENMYFNVFATGHCLFHDIDEDAFIMTQIVFWFVFLVWLRNIVF
jgi:hypothetical protein